MCKIPPENRATKQIRYSYIYQFEYIKKNGKEVGLKEPNCYKNGELTLFTEILKGIKMNKRCEDMEIEGTTYYSLEIDEKGNFSNLKVLRSVSNCLISVDKEIESRSKAYEVLSSEYHNSEVIFGFKARIR